MKSIIKKYAIYKLFNLQLYNSDITIIRLKSLLIAYLKMILDLFFVG